MKVPLDWYSEELLVRRSRFIAEGWPLDDPGSSKERVAAVRRAHPGCNHVVWAYRCGNAGEIVGMSDDREPKGTAGRPVLEVIRGSAITNLLITVTRYFGGTKLGTGGLVKAYTEAARRVVAGIAVREHVERRSFRLAVPYTGYEAMLRIARELDVVTTREQFTDQVVLEGTVPSSAAGSFVERVRDATGGGVEPEFS